MYPETENESDHWQALGGVAGGLFGAFIGSELDVPGIILGGAVGCFLGALLLSIGNPTPASPQAQESYRRRRLRIHPTVDSQP